MSSDPTSLDRLHDIVVPPPVSWWPPAPAWYWVLGFLVVAGLILTVAGVIRWQRHKYRREALALWRKESKDLHDPARRTQALVRLAELLKRTALTAFPRDQVAALTGSAWFSFLDRTAPQKNFDSTAAKMLEDASYDSRLASSIDDVQARQIAGAVRRWIQQHTIT